MSIHHHFDLLGRKVTDKVTGFRGIVTTLTFDLYGCIQVLIHPGLGKDGKPLESHWFDVNRLTVERGNPVMQRPDFVLGPVAEGRKGPAEKPAMRSI